MIFKIQYDDSNIFEINFQEFSLHRTNRGTVLTKVTDSLQTMTHAHTIKQRHLEFEQIRDYCTSLSEKLNTIDKIGLRIHKERQGTYKNDRQNNNQLIINSLHDVLDCRLRFRITAATSTIRNVGKFRTGIITSIIVNR